MAVIDSGLACAIIAQPRLNPSPGLGRLPKHAFRVLQTRTSTEPWLRTEMNLPSRGIGSELETHAIVRHQSAISPCSAKRERENAKLSHPDGCIPGNQLWLFKMEVTMIIYGWKDCACMP